MSRLLDRVEALALRDDEMTAWECDFIESVLSRLHDGRELTEAQEAKIADIEERLG